MGINNTVTVTCDCCGYVAGVGEAYATLRVTTFATTGAVTMSPDKYLCKAKNCDAHFVTSTGSMFTNDRTTHLNAFLTTPTGLAVAAVGTGGTFAAATYFWKITATSTLVETLGSNEATVAIALNGSANLTWTAVTGATGYRIYRSTTAGGEGTSPAFVAAVGAVTAYTDTGVAVAAGAVPATLVIPNHP